jgi:hypothetical protein
MCTRYSGKAFIAWTEPERVILAYAYGQDANIKQLVRSFDDSTLVGKTWKQTPPTPRSG